MKRLLIPLAIIALCLSASAQSQQSIEGTWLGGLSFNGTSLRLAFHIAKSATGFTATMDSIDQGARGIPVLSATQQGDTIAIDMSNIGAKFEGKLGADASSINGTWAQSGASLPLVLKRVTEESLVQRRPQNPVKPYPYREEDVVFENKSAAIKLAGTLTLPPGKGPFKAAVLITGSGPQNRDEELLGHRPFLVLSDYLTRLGIAVLRFDDRGIAKSEGNYSASTSADFATDAEAAIAYLTTRAEIDPHHIGLIGHSEGGMIAPMVAAHNSDVSFIVMMAGTAVPGSLLIPEQAKLLAIASGLPPDKAEERAQRERDSIAIVVGEKDPAIMEKKLRESLARWIPDAEVNGEFSILTSPWFRYFLSYDPAPSLAKVKCPVLAINGSLDMQVPPAQNLPLIRQSLERAGNKHYEVVELPGLNHLFQTAKTGAVSEYAQIEETISPVVLDKIANWVLKN